MCVRWIPVAAALRTVGLDPRVVKPDVDEAEIPGEKPSRMVSRLSREKALAVAERLDRAKPTRRSRVRVIIAADTTVVAPDDRTVLG